MVAKPRRRGDRGARWDRRGTGGGLTHKSHQRGKPAVRAAGDDGGFAHLPRDPWASAWTTAPWAPRRLASFLWRRKRGVIASAFASSAVVLSRRLARGSGLRTVLFREGGFHRGRGVEALHGGRPRRDQPRAEGLGGVTQHPRAAAGFAGPAGGMRPARVAVCAAAGGRRFCDLPSLQTETHTNSLDRPRSACPAAGFPQTLARLPGNLVGAAARRSDERETFSKPRRLRAGVLTPHCGRPRPDRLASRARARAFRGRSEEIQGRGRGGDRRAGGDRRLAGMGIR